jgi:hypothetical protein
MSSHSQINCRLHMSGRPGVAKKKHHPTPLSLSPKKLGRRTNALPRRHSTNGDDKEAASGYFPTGEVCERAGEQRAHHLTCRDCTELSDTYSSAGGKTRGLGTLT